MLAVDALNEQATDELSHRAELIQELASQLAYWLPDKEPLLFQHDEVSEAHKAKYREANRLLQCVVQDMNVSLTE